MPTKTVFQHTCERCKRPWFADEEKKSPSIIVRGVMPDGSTLGGELNCLCDSCEKTVLDAIKVIFKEMKKNAPRKSGAKEKATGASSEPELSTSAGAPERTSATDKPRRSPDGPSTRS